MFHRFLLKKEIFVLKNQLRPSELNFVEQNNSVTKFENIEKFVLSLKRCRRIKSNLSRLNRYIFLFCYVFLLCKVLFFLFCVWLSVFLFRFVERPNNKATK